MAAGLVVLFTVINLYGIKFLSRLNGAISVWKIVTIILTIVVLATSFHSSNFFSSSPGGVFPAGVHGMIAALSVGGVIFALVGFEQAVQVGGESERPGRDIPRAVIG